MMIPPRIRHQFAEALTMQGLQLLYRHEIAQLRTIVVLNGTSSPHISSYLENTLSFLHQQGVLPEMTLFHAFSDPAVLTGMIFPTQHVAILSHDVYHMVQPFTLNQTIMHLDIPNRGPQETSMEFDLLLRSQNMLAVSQHFQEEIGHYYCDDNTTRHVFRNLIREWTPPYRSTIAESHHFFASPLTRIGPVSFLPSLVSSLRHRILLSGGHGANYSENVIAFGESMLQNGYDVEFYHCHLEPNHIEHLIVPKMSLALISTNAPFTIAPKQSDRVVDLHLHNSASYPLSEMEALYSGYQQAFHRAWQILDALPPPAPTRPIDPRTFHQLVHTLNEQIKTGLLP